MIQHVVLFRTLEGTPKEHIQQACGRLEALVGVIPGLRSMNAGIDIGIEGNFDFGLLAMLDDRKALDVFSTHPAHMEVAYFILDFRKDTAIFDVEV